MNFKARQIEALDLRGANEEQRAVIECTEGPVLVLAGPGTGKTFTLVKRIAYLLLEKDVQPQNLFVSTFTEKAAHELTTRIANELEGTEKGESVNLSDMYIGTFHAICLKLISEFAEYSTLPKNYKTADEAELQYLITQNINSFWKLPHFRNIVKHLGSGTAALANGIIRTASCVSEELLPIEELLAHPNPNFQGLGEIVQEFQRLLAENGLIDFSKMQAECYRIFKENPQARDEIQDRLRYLMVDEYQDTNHIQEELLFLLGAKTGNICVVGDDDQGIYRFRGATVRNILEFERTVAEKLPGRTCNVFILNKNYRSNSTIINFYNKWMDEIYVEGTDYSWQVGDRAYRRDKAIIRAPRLDADDNEIPEPTYDFPPVSKIIGKGEDWSRSIVQLVKALKEAGKISDYNQVAFIAGSVRNPRSIQLQRVFENAGIGIYSPRSRLFFKQPVIKLLYGLLLQMFYSAKPVLSRKTGESYRGSVGWMLDKRFADTIAEKRAKQESLNGKGPGKTAGREADQLENYKAYCEECLKLAQQQMDRSRPLHDYITSLQEDHLDFIIEQQTFTDLLYHLLVFRPFKGMLNDDLQGNVAEQRDLRNIALFFRMVAGYEQLSGVSKADGKARYDLFGRYLFRRYTSGMDEYEDEEGQLPSGCVSFMTIHQSKGLEFPVVIADISNVGISLFDKSSLVGDAVRQLQGREPFEPTKQTECYDLWRKYYTAFSRAKDLLVLADKTDEKALWNHQYGAFDALEGEARGWVLPDFDPQAITPDARPSAFSTVENSTLKPVFSFTTHFALYETCPRQYKLQRELNFPSHRTGNMQFGTLVHQTIEDVNRAALAGKDDAYLREHLQDWLNTNCASMNICEHIIIGEDQRHEALQQVERYMEMRSGKWDELREAEVPVSLVRDDYIAKGAIDLVRSRNDGNALELIDFKTGDMPQRLPDGSLANPAEDEAKLNRYKKQLDLYASIVSSHADEQGNPRIVDSTRLYYVKSTDDDPTIPFDVSEDSIVQALADFDGTAAKIIAKDFDGTAADDAACRNCNFRFYCSKERF